LLKVAGLIFLVAFGFIACSLSGNQATMMVKAQAFSGIDIISPSNSTYTSNIVPLVVNGTEFVAGGNIYVFMYYSLDGQSNQSLSLATGYPWNFLMMVERIASVNLNLPVGSHNITVYAEYIYPNNAGGNTTNHYSKTVYFNIVPPQTTPAPTESQPFFSGIDVLAPANITYDSNLLPLIVRATRQGGSDSYVFMNYSLDWQSSQSIPLATEQPMNSSMVVHTGTANLLNLSNGTHSITVYAEYVHPSSVSPPTNVTEFYSKTVYFSGVVWTTTPAPTETPTATPSASPSPSASPTEQQSPQSTQTSVEPSPTVPEFPTEAVAVTLIVVAVAAELVLLKRATGRKQLG
jgi:hypothetical protein